MNTSTNELHGIPAGLTEEAAVKLKSEGKSNFVKNSVGKSYAKILCENLFTFFNMIWVVITAVLIICESYSNLTFLVVVLLNTVIAIIQEIKAKRTVEKLSVTTDPRAAVIRDGELKTVDSADIVLGDVMLIESGRQVLSDAIVISGLAEANESLLTGESDAIKKTVGAQLLAGSFLVSGSVYARVNRVGKDNYASKIERAAKSFKAPSSNLFRDLNVLIKMIGVLMIPLAILVFLSNYVAYPNVTEAIIKTCGSLTAMIPAGIYLLVTMTLTLSVITLAKKQTLVGDMYSIEMLATADVICLDKTGTITDGSMQVVKFCALGNTGEDEFFRIMSVISGCTRTHNSTSRALADYFGKDVSEHPILSEIPFSSTRKYSGVSIKDFGTYTVGAPHFVPCPIDDELEALINEETKEGHRVLITARHEAQNKEGVPIGIISISDRIRPGAEQTIRNFQSQGVTVKVLSGDHAQTVSKIAMAVGIDRADKYLSCESLSDDELRAAAEKYAIFGRVTPEQKLVLISELKKNGHTVAMTGDGVNDTLALKESNCAIAMADGSEMARKISQIVLLDSDFSSLPDVVREGRRCINNVRSSASLFLMKTVFTIFIALFSIITLSGYPFAPNQTLMLELFIIGLGSVLLALEPNDKRIRGSFLKTVIIKSLPNALAMFIPVMLLILLEKTTAISLNARNSIAMAIVTAIGFLNLASVCRPFTKWRIMVISTVGALLAITVPVSIFFFNDLFGFGYISESYTVFSIMFSVGIVWTFVLHTYRKSIEKSMERHMRERLMRIGLPQRKRRCRRKRK